MPILARRIIVCTAALVLAAVQAADAQTPPSIGYMFPSGASAGQTVEVVLGGYDWTPDMQLFVHDERIKLQMLAPPGEVIVPEPPYWFGKKARRPPFPLPREMRVRLTIPAGVSPGMVRWQAANANGATASGRFVIGEGDELLEVDDRREPQSLAALPVTVSGRIKRIEEVDRYRFTATKTGPVTCAVVARAIGSPLNAVIEVHDSLGRRIASVADTAGNDTALTFAAAAKQSYTVSIFDVDFRGNRSFVYRLSLVAAGRVVAAIPAAGRRGQTRQVELIGYGIASGAAKLESVTRKISFPTDKTATSFRYRLETPHGICLPFSLIVSDLPETIEPARTGSSAPLLSFPAAVTGLLEERFGEDQYRVAGKKGDVWVIHLSARQIASPLDVVLTVTGADGKELARSDDLPGSTDAALAFSLPADGEYRIGVGDLSGRSGNRAAVYRLTVEPPRADFTLSVPELLNVPLGSKAKLSIKATRTGGFKNPISITLANLPAGVSVPKNLIIPEGKTALSVDLDVSAKAAASASLVRISGQAKSIRRTAGPLLIATTIKPPFSIDAEGQDDVTKWPRGTTFPAPVLIQRDQGFNGRIVLEMTSRQGRHRQGIRGPELPVPPGTKRILYPVFLPEWLETTRTSRMVVNGVAKVTDPQGKVRYSLTRQKTRMGFLPTGALLKLAADVREFQAMAGEAFSVPLTIRRAKQLTEPVRLELITGDGNTAFAADSINLSAGQTQTVFPITPGSAARAKGEYELTIRATLLQNGTLPVVSETKVIVQIGSSITP
ncbi:MAG: hypothetical protein IID44_04270 [Planctomycetes bacterium]|nr:hypothetical protein [Planctomycetota bacterium]